MGKYSVAWKKSVLKDVAAIPKKDLQRIIAAIQALCDNPRPPQAKKLTGLEYYRVRQGNYRILYSIEDAASLVVVVAVGHRKDIYR
jgi:mRNA interferase RelE/StbE